MRVSATDAAADVVRRARSTRQGVLTITLGTGCCESTARDAWFQNYSVVIAEDAASSLDVVAGVDVRPGVPAGRLPGDDGVVIDLYEGPAESMSIETEWGCRLVLRGLGLDIGRSSTDESCMVPPAPATQRRSAAELDVGQRVKGELPEALRGFRVR
jgi:uncharacterized protein (DUF779 family)